MHDVRHAYSGEQVPVPGTVLGHMTRYRSLDVPRYGYLPVLASFPVLQRTVLLPSGATCSLILSTSPLRQVSRTASASGTRSPHPRMSQMIPGPEVLTPGETPQGQLVISALLNLAQAIEQKITM